MLWNGTLASRDNVLQLILIFDYICDWARDIYRPSIIRQLKSLATGRPYDEVSLLYDSEIESLRRTRSPASGLAGPPRFITPDILSVYSGLSGPPPIPILKS